jgi:response regulator of citrate/malate metabolism
MYRGIRPADKVTGYLERVYPRWASKTAMHNRALTNNASAAELDRALEHLASEGVLEIRMVQGEIGRPRQEYRLLVNQR